MFCIKPTYGLFEENKKFLKHNFPLTLFNYYVVLAQI